MKQKSGRKLLSFLLTLAMVVGLMPGMGLTAYAAESYNLWVGGVQVTSENLTIDSTDDAGITGGSATFDPATNTLTLNNSTYTGPGHNDYGEGGGVDCRMSNLTIVLKSSNSIVKISTQPCLVNTVEELKELVETDLKSKECNIQESGMESFDNYGIWDIIYITKEGLEVEQYSILKDNNLYSLELYTKNNRDQVAVKSFVELIQTFKILKPVYKINGDSYEKI